MIRQYDSYDLTRRNTFRMRVSCRLFVECTALSDLSTLDFSALPQPVLTMGGGSNLLFTKDFQGTVLHLAFKGRTVRNAPDGTVTVRLGAGVVFDGFCAWAAAEGLWGPENLSLIPGDVGASAVQNIGAYGAEVKDLIWNVEAVDIHSGLKVVLSSKDCQYGYRDSKFKKEWKNKYFITAVTYRLSEMFTPQLDYGNIREQLAAKGIEQPTAKQLREVIIGIRQSKLPDPKVEGNAGSFFVNPVVSHEKYRELAMIYPGMPHYRINDEQEKIPAGWLIERCGWKGKTRGAAGVHDKQSLVLVNKGGATGKDILALCEAVRHDVLERFGISIQTEVNII